jgi:hypothetical protein
MQQKQGTSEESAGLQRQKALLSSGKVCLNLSKNSCKRKSARDGALFCDSLDRRLRNRRPSPEDPA